MRKILLIDDDFAVLRMAARMLDAAGYACLAHSTAEAGLDALDRGAFAAVLTDIQMPGMGGQEFILNIKATFPGLPVIAISGSGPSHGDDALKYAHRLGASAVLGKPFRSAELVAALHQVLGDDTK